MVLTAQDLKVDQTILQSGERGVFVTNINIPEYQLGNLNAILDRARLLIVNDYVNVFPIEYQVCASYELRNTETGDLRQWTGSFNPRGNQSNVLNTFEPFTPSFKQIVSNACAPANIFQKLHLYHVPTNWVFHKLTSIVISVQAVVHLNHPTLLRRGILIRQHGRRKRTVSSFLLP